MYIVQGWRQEAEEVCLHALLENPEGQAQVVGKVEASWKCQEKKTSNKKQKAMANSSPSSSAPETAPALTPVAGGGDGLMVNHQVDRC